MKAGSRQFPGEFNEIEKDSSIGSSINRFVPTVRANIGLTSVSSVNGKVRGQKLQLINRPHSYSKIVNTGRTGVKLITRQSTNGSTYFYSKSGDFGTEGSLLFQTDGQSYNDALGKLGDVIRGGIDLSIDAFQARKTLELAKRILSVRKIVQTIAEHTWKDTSARRRQTSTLTRNRAYSHKRDRRDRHEAKAQSFQNPMQDVGSLYLEFTYGLKPTLQTIFDLVKGEATRVGNNINIKSPYSHFNGVTGKFKAQVTDNSTTNGIKTFDTFESSFRTKIGGTYLPSNSYIESLSRLTSLNPASILWELLPFSFVIDWFYDVGGYLRGCETALVSKLGTFNGYISRTTKYSRTFSEVGVGKDLQLYLHSGGTKGETARYDFNRSVITSIPFPRPPVFRADLSSKRMINAAALLSQFIGRK